MNLFRSNTLEDNMTGQQGSSDDRPLEENLKLFQDLGSQAYNILRKNAHTLINLLSLMVVGEISQLNQDSIRFLIDRLKLTKTDEESSADFKSKIDKATTATRRRFDSVAHNLMDEWKKGKQKKAQQAANINNTQT